MKFEVGKAYQHATGEKLQIICEVDTFFTVMDYYLKQILLNMV